MFRRMSFGTDNFFDITLCIDSAIKLKSRNIARTKVNQKQDERNLGRGRAMAG